MGPDILKSLSRFAAVLLIAAAWPVASRAADFETGATHAILLDTATETVLFQKAADVRMPPASMAKLMTSAVIFDAIKSGRLSLDQQFVVSERAWREGGAGSGGSTMFAKLGSSIKVSDLIRGIIVQSGNDACMTMAEGMAGTEAAFAGLMNAEAKKIGLTGSHFTNATGLPDPNQFVTARDLAKLADYIIREFPSFYEIYSETEFTWNKIRQLNRNPLLEAKIGADGLKTGFTEDSGYGLVGSVVRNGERLIIVINGSKTDKERAADARKLVDWGFQDFGPVTLFEDGATVAAAAVFGGAAPTVEVANKGPLVLLLPREARDRVELRVVYQGPVPAPVASGQKLGTLRVMIDGSVAKETPLYAKESVEVGTLRERATDGLKELAVGWWARIHQMVFPAKAGA